MKYFIAFGIWLVLGGIISFILNCIGVSMTRNKERPGFNGFSPLFIGLSFVRLYVILLLIAYATGWKVPSLNHVIIICADIGFGLLMMLSCANRYGTTHPIAYMKTGQTIGSILFLIYYGVRFYIL